MSESSTFEFKAVSVDVRPPPRKKRRVEVSTSDSDSDAEMTEAIRQGVCLINLTFKSIRFLFQRFLAQKVATCGVKHNRKKRLTT